MCVRATMARIGRRRWTSSVMALSTVLLVDLAACSHDDSTEGGSELSDPDDSSDAGRFDHNAFVVAGDRKVLVTIHVDRAPKPEGNSTGESGGLQASAADLAREIPEMKENRGIAFVVAPSSTRRIDLGPLAKPVSIAYIDGKSRVIAVAELPSGTSSAIVTVPEKANYVWLMPYGWHREHGTAADQALTLGESLTVTTAMEDM